MNWCTFIGGRPASKKAGEVIPELPSELARTKLGFEPDEKQRQVWDAPVKRGMLPVLITSGAGWRQGEGAWHVPKVDLMAGLQAALEMGELRIARGMREAGTLVRELLDVRVKERGGEGDEFRG